MNIYVYSDESGVFDVAHNDYYVYGGLIFLDKESRDNCSRKYLSIERMLRDNHKYNAQDELKACRISNKEKYTLLKSVNNYFRFGAIIHQNKLLPRIFMSKKSKQRYLDYAYKISLKKALCALIKEEKINPEDVANIYVYADEHTTATDGKYELQEALEQEFKWGTFNVDYRIFYDPIFKNMQSVILKLCDSSTKTLIRAADIVANNIYYKAVNGIQFDNDKKLYLTRFP